MYNCFFKTGIALSKRIWTDSGYQLPDLPLVIQRPIFQPQIPHQTLLPRSLLHPKQNPAETWCAQHRPQALRQTDQSLSSARLVPPIYYLGTHQSQYKHHFTLGQPQGFWKESLCQTLGLCTPSVESYASS